MLYLVATPIGNLGDITYRALETLKACDYVLCEDTRHSISLLTHYEIHKPLKSLHKYSDASRIEEIIQDLLSGMCIALISDAGTPGISDPGTFLVQKCIEHPIKIIAIPGACAAITALSCSGLNTDRFQFFGFLPRKAGERRLTLQDILTYSGTTICYESPNRLLHTLQSLHELAPTRKIVICRELTKKFEEIQRGSAEELIRYWESHPLKGEIVLLITGEKQGATEEWKQFTPEEHVIFLQESYHLSRQEAIKMAAKMRGVPKRDLYKVMLSHAENHAG